MFSILIWVAGISGAFEDSSIVRSMFCARLMACSFVIRFSNSSLGRCNASILSDTCSIIFAVRGQNFQSEPTIPLDQYVGESGQPCADSQERSADNISKSDNAHHHLLFCL